MAKIVGTIDGPWRANMYEFMGQQRRRTVRGMRGFGALPGDEGCPPMTSRFGIPNGTCFPLFGAAPSTGPSCPDGSTPFVDPSGSGVFVCMPTGAPPPVPVPAPAGATTCPDGTTGIPPFCFTMPAAAPPAVMPSVPGLPAIPAVPTAPCPPGTFGVQPVCIPVPGAAPPPGAGPPPPVAPKPPPASMPAPAAAAAASTTPSWVLPAAIGVGVIAAFALLTRKPRRATPNRRHR